jgi:hypothetical protein
MISFLNICETDEDRPTEMMLNVFISMSLLSGVRSWKMEDNDANHFAAHLDTHFVYLIVSEFIHLN